VNGHPAPDAARLLAARGRRPARAVTGLWRPGVAEPRPPATGAGSTAVDDAARVQPGQASVPPAAGRPSPGSGATGSLSPDRPSPGSHAPGRRASSLESRLAPAGPGTSGPVTRNGPPTGPAGTPGLADAGPEPASGNVARRTRTSRAARRHAGQPELPPATMIETGDLGSREDPAPPRDAVHGMTPTASARNRSAATIRAARLSGLAAPGLDGSQLAERALRQAAASTSAAWPRAEPAPSVRAELVPAGAAPATDPAAGIPALREGARPEPGHPPVAIGEIHVHVAAPPAAGADPLALLAPYALGLTARRDGAR
jgi:hypothetical protein